jgi:hypothetical protein
MTRTTTVSSARILACGLALFLTVTLNCASAFAQAISGNLRGTVVDPSGAAVSGAAVEAVNLATNQRVTTSTRSFGDYLFSDLPAGTYKITVSAPNFRTVTLDNIPVDINKTGTTNVKLEIGSSSTTVESRAMPRPSTLRPRSYNPPTRTVCRRIWASLPPAAPALAF